MKILLCENIDLAAIEMFHRAGFAVDALGYAPTPQELIAKANDYVLIGIRSRTKLSAEYFAASKGKLLAVGCFCIGTNQVDLDAAMRAGVPVFNSPFANTRSVAEMVLATIISLLRRLGEHYYNMHQGKWIKTAKNSFEARGKRLGIVGYGNIGTQVGILAESLGMEVLFYDVVPKLPLSKAERVNSLEELCSRTDIVTVHTPLDTTTDRLFGKKIFALMKQGSYFINFARGTVVVLDDLHEALASGHLAGAALDVYPEEPKANEDVFTHAISSLPNVYLTPHIAGSTAESQANIGMDVAGKLTGIFLYGNTSAAVNFPNISLPQVREGNARFLHIHENKPGMLASVNEVFSAMRINIAGEHLNTNNDIGYLVIDAECSEEFVLYDCLERVKKLPHTLSARLVQE